jgi:hypothetical protein
VFLEINIKVFIVAVQFLEIILVKTKQVLLLAGLVKEIDEIH